MNTPLALGAQRATQSTLRGLSAEILTTIAGMSGAAGVVGLNVVLQRALDFDLLGLTLAFIIPVGALYGGAGAAAGYFVAARITSTLPNRRMLFEMLAIALSTWLLMHWVEYVTLRFSDGSPIRDAVPFWDYLLITTEHMRLTIQSGGVPTDTTSELGLLGYAHQLLQIGGFLFGAYIVWKLLSALEVCKPCSRYARSRRVLQRAPSAEFDGMLARAGIALPLLPERIAQAIGKKRLVGLNLHLVTCPSCQRNWLRPQAVAFEGQHPVVKPMATYDITPAQAAALRN
jgi:hypothetical protein